MNNSPNFLIVGAAKSGSTTLYHILKQHPDVFMPKFKEPLFFISDSIKNINKKDVFFKNEGNEKKYIHDKSYYLKLFEPVKNEKVVGEASATYLYYYKESIPKIKEELKDPKIIIILRNPVNKVFSQFKHLKRFHAEESTFEKGLELEDKRIFKNYTAMYHYKAQGLYFEQVKAFKDNFSKVLVLYTDHLKDNPEIVARKCYKFLNIDDDFKPDFKDYNVSIKRIKNRFFHKILYNRPVHSVKMFLKNIFGNSFYESSTKRYKKLNFERINYKIEEKTRKELKNYFKKDIEKLEQLLCEDLSRWKN